jgi:methyl-accepting chemotaxis protein
MDAVEAIREIGATISEMHQIATSVAAAVEQQQAATQEIARNVHEAARGTHEVTENIDQVQGTATHSGAAASQVLSAAVELARNVSSLSREVDGFLAGIKAA